MVKGGTISCDPSSVMGVAGHSNAHCVLKPGSVLGPVSDLILAGNHRFGAGDERLMTNPAA